MHALVQIFRDSRRVRYEEIEKAAVNVAFDGTQKATKRGVEAKNLYYDINAKGDSILAHCAYGRPDCSNRQTYPHAALGP